MAIVNFPFKEQIPVLVIRRIAIGGLAIFSAIMIGAAGFFVFENLGFIDSIYLATETVTTVGYGDIVPKTRSGRIFTIFFMILGAGTVLYALTSIVSSIVQTDLLSVIDNRRKNKEMEKLHDHYIICGAGRVGRRISRTLRKNGISFVIVDTDERKLEQIRAETNYSIIGDATSEQTLARAGVENAAGLASCLPDDALNVYVVLTARGMNQKLYVVARAVEEEAEPKLIRAGANRVYSPTIIGSQSMARALIKPAIADFMESIVAENLDLAFDEVSVGETSIYANQKLRDTNIGSDLDLIIVAIRRQNGEMIFHPSGETTIHSLDLLIIIGHAESVQKLQILSK